MLSAKRTGRLAAALCCLALLAGCTDPFGLEEVPTDVPAAEIVAMSGCPRNASVLQNDDEARPRAGSVPSAFVAQTLVRCRSDRSVQQLRKVDRYSVVEDRAPVTPSVLQALALADQRFTSSHAACAAAAPAPDTIFLIDSAGRGIRVRLPRQPCDVRLETTKAIAALTFSRPISYRVDVTR